MIQSASLRRFTQDPTYISFVGSFNALVTRLVKTRIRSEHHALNRQQNLQIQKQERILSLVFGSSIFESESCLGELREPAIQVRIIAKEHG